MAQLTIEIPDEFLPNAERLQGELSDLVVQRLVDSGAAAHQALSPSVLPASLYRQILEFLAGNPTPEEIMAFKAPDEIQSRVRALLDRNKAGALTPDENTELDEYENIEHFIMMLKAGNLQAFSAVA